MSATLREHQAQGFLLLTLPNCVIWTPAGSHNGTVALQCVTIPSEAIHDRDVWLVLKLNSFEMIVSPTQVVDYDRSNYTYTFLPEDEHGELVQLTITPNPNSPASYQDLETMEVVLSQYGIVHGVGRTTLQEKESRSNAETTASLVGGGDGPSELKGRLVLMDEKDGEIVATLDDAVPIKEDKSLASQGHGKDPVVFDLPGEDVPAGAREAYVHPVSAEEQDLLMKTVGLISRGIVLATSAVASGMTSASQYYISHSNPTSKPVVFSPSTRANMKRIHKISGSAVTVTGSTTRAIFKAVDRVAGRLAGPSTRSAGGGHYPPSQPQLLPPPPLPPRSGSPSSQIQGVAPSISGAPTKGYGMQQVGAGAPQIGAPLPLPARRRGLLNRLLASTDVLLTTVEQSAKHLIETGTDAVSASLAHKYGQDAGDASRLARESVRNVGLVYIDVKGVARRALLRKAGKAVVKARFGHRDVIFGQQAQAMQPPGSVYRASAGDPLTRFSEKDLSSRKEGY